MSHNLCIDVRRPRVHGRVNSQRIDIVHLAVDIPDEREESVNNGVDKAMCDPVRGMVVLGPARKGKDAIADA